jgi:surfactin synthase thioesterase subunit/NADP-dependent 3-hydroxy acid dehydrogenase YdfG
VFCRQLAVDYASHSAQVDPILGRIRQELVALSPREGAIPFYSTVTGQLLSGTALNNEYWANNLRLPVRLDLALEALGQKEGVVFVEVSAHPLLAGPLESAGYPAVVGTLQREAEAASEIRRAAAVLCAHGPTVNWSAVYEGTGARRVELPTYAFQHEHYWLAETKTEEGGAKELGLWSGGHPILVGKTELPDGSVLFTGRLDLSAQPWLADHQVFDTVVMPGAALVEWALHAAWQLGLGGVAEAAVSAPLALAAGEARQVQLWVASEEKEGVRRFTLRSRPMEEGPHSRWIEHLTGQLGSVSGAELSPLGLWPPEGARAVDIAALYETLKANGLSYGPSLQGVRRVWRAGEAVYVEADLPSGLAIEEDAYGLHPALLDSVVHGLLACLEVEEGGGSDVKLPFAWRDVTLVAVRASALRARLVPSERGQETRIELYDVMGAPVGLVGGLGLRAAHAEQVHGALARGRATHLYSVATEPVPWAETHTEARPRLEVAVWPAAEVTAAAVHRTVSEGLAWLKNYLSDGLERARAVWVTRDAIALSANDRPPSPAAAALWGLARTFQAEHSDRRLVLLDTDVDVDLDRVLSRLPEGDNQLLLRGGALEALRLRQVESAGPYGTAVPGIDPTGTVLVTGATGTLGRLTARHLVAKHQVRHLLLLSRAGAEAPAAAAWVEELKSIGAETVTLRACDVADRNALAAALADIPAERPLRGIFHLAALKEDGLLAELTPERVEAALRPKVDAAFHLHELTRGIDLSAFVLFSSLTATLGSSGQASYAAANAALDGLAEARHRQGLAGKSLAWGTWAKVGPADELGDELRRRLRRSGFAPLAPEAGMRLMDEALSRPEAVLVPVHLDRAALERSPADRAEEVPPLLRKLLRVPVRRAATAPRGAAWTEKLAQLSESEHQAAVLEVVRTEVALVLGLTGPDAVPVDRPLQQLGVHSLMAARIRARVSERLAMKLPISLFLDYSIPQQLAEVIASTRSPGTTRHEPAVEHADSPVESAGRLTASRPPVMLCLKRCSSPHLRLLVVPGAGARVSSFYPLVASLPSHIEPWGVELPGRGIRSIEEPQHSMDQLIARLMTDELISLVKEGPFALLGFSLGALIAFELALALRRSLGVEPVHFLPAAMGSPAGAFVKSMKILAPRSDQELLDFVARQIAPNYSSRELVQEVADGDKNALVVPMRNDLRLLESYAGSSDKLLSSPITALCGVDDDPAIVSNVDSWKEQTTAAFRVEWMDGGHFFYRSASPHKIAAIIEHSMTAETRNAG